MQLFPLIFSVEYRPRGVDPTQKLISRDMLIISFPLGALSIDMARGWERERGRQSWSWWILAHVVKCYYCNSVTRNQKFFVLCVCVCFWHCDKKGETVSNNKGQYIEAHARTRVLLVVPTEEVGLPVGLSADTSHACTHSLPKHILVKCSSFLKWPDCYSNTVTVTLQSI